MNNANKYGHKDDYSEYDEYENMKVGTPQPKAKVKFKEIKNKREVQ